jgi:hypothetical protein
MSDLLVIQGTDAITAQAVLDAWARGRAWVRSATTRDAWEPLQLEINGRNARGYMQGKHKFELAELVRAFGEVGGRVVHVMLHRAGYERSERNLAEWADQAGGTGE